MLSAKSRPSISSLTRNNGLSGRGVESIRDSLTTKEMEPDVQLLLLKCRERSHTDKVCLLYLLNQYDESRCHGFRTKDYGNVLHLGEVTGPCDHLTVPEVGR